MGRVESLRSIVGSARARVVRRVSCLACELLIAEPEKRLEVCGGRRLSDASFQIIDICGGVATGQPYEQVIEKFRRYLSVVGGRGSRAAHGCHGGRDCRGGQRMVAARGRYLGAAERSNERARGDGGRGDQLQLYHRVLPSRFAVGGADVWR